MQETLESRRYELFRRLNDKLLLETGQARSGPPLVGRIVVPIVDASDLLLDQVIAQANMDLDVGAGSFITAHTVPVGERWSLVSMNRELTAANSHVEINISVANINHQLSLDTTAFQIIDVQGIKLQVGDRIGMISTDNVADGAIFLRVIYNRELVGLSQ